MDLRHFAHGGRGLGWVGTGGGGDGGGGEGLCGSQRGTVKCCHIELL